MVTLTFDLGDPKCICVETISILTCVSSSIEIRPPIHELQSNILDVDSLGKTRTPKTVTPTSQLNHWQLCPATAVSLGRKRFFGFCAVDSH